MIFSCLPTLRVENRDTAALAGSVQVTLTTRTPLGSEDSAQFDPFQMKYGTGAAPQEGPELIHEFLDPVVSAAPTLRDQAGVLLLGRLALRKNDLRMLQLADIDLARDEVYLRHAKGGKEHVLPLAFPDVREILYLHLQRRGGRPDEYLIYPKAHRAWPMSAAGIDHWFRRCVTEAGLAGYTMHQLRHAAIDQVRRMTGDVEMARLTARHENVAVRQGYLHTNEVEDLRAAIERAVKASV